MKNKTNAPAIVKIAVAEMYRLANILNIPFKDPIIEDILNIKYLRHRNFEHEITYTCYDKKKFMLSVLKYDLKYWIEHDFDE